MSPGDPLQSEGDRCVVCGKSVEHRSVMAYIQHGDKMVALCCRLCIETFNEYPERCVAKDRVRLLMQGDKPDRR